MNDDAAVFEAERGRLRALGYRMLGSLIDADDVVQDTWLRWQSIGDERRAEIERPAAWLTTAATRIALDRLKSAQRTREQYVGPWLPEPVLTDDDPADSRDRRAIEVDKRFAVRLTVQVRDPFSEMFQATSTTRRRETRSIPLTVPAAYPSKN